jgi:hypothetical protein
VCCLRERLSSGLDLGGVSLCSFESSIDTLATYKESEAHVRLTVSKVRKVDARTLARLLPV